MIKPGLVTLEFSTIIVRFHDTPTVFGKSDPYRSGFVLHQIAPNVYEAKLAKDANFEPSHQRELTEKMVELGAVRVDILRHKKGEPSYKLSIHSDGKITREFAQKTGDQKAPQSI